MGYERLGTWVSDWLGVSCTVSSSCLVFVLSCLRIWFGRGICLGGWLLNLHHETQLAPHRMACLFAQFLLCTSAVPSSPFCPPRDRTCPALSFPTCSAICASLYRSVDIRTGSDALSLVVSLRTEGMMECRYRVVKVAGQTSLRSVLVIFITYNQTPRNAACVGRTLVSNEGENDCPR